MTPVGRRPVTAATRIPSMVTAMTCIMPRPVTARAPAAVVAMVPVVMIMPVAARVITDTERSPAPAQSEVPAAPGVVADIEAPGAVAGVVIIRRYPGLVVPAGSVNNRVVIDVAAGIARRVTYINHVRRSVVDPDILDVVHRRCGQDRVHLGRPPGSNLPRAAGRS